MNDNKLAQVFHYDLYGKREEKYEFLNTNSLEKMYWFTLELMEPNFNFRKLDRSNIEIYNRGFTIPNLFNNYSNGVTSERDQITIHFEIQTLINTVNDLKELKPEEFRLKHDNKPDGRDWTVASAKADVLNSKLFIINILYRPFDYRLTFYSGKTKGFFAFPRGAIMNNFLTNNNIGLIIPKQTKDNVGAFISRNIAGHKSFSAYDKNSIFPLYLISDDQIDIDKTIQNNRIPNLNPQIVQQLAGQLALTFTPEKEPTPCTFAPIDILDYIYAILHSPTYRAKYKEFLKIDFPRIPYPKDQETFWKFVKLGGELRQIHLLESPVVERFITSYPVSGTNEVGKVKYEEEKVWINESQYFDHVPQEAWEFYIGGYQPAQKWLKDRKGRQLSFEDVRHYQKIIVALTKTDRIMKEIDKVEFE